MIRLLEPMDSQIWPANSRRIELILIIIYYYFPAKFPSGLTFGKHSLSNLLIEALLLIEQFCAFKPDRAASKLELMKI